MKFDPLSWHEVKNDAETEVGKGFLRVRLSAPSALYIKAQGYEALAGFGTSFDLEISEAVTFRVDAPPRVRVFYHRVRGTSLKVVGEVFTNIDRAVDESVSMAEVTRARRQLELERRSMLREIRAHREALITDLRSSPDPVVEPITDPVVPE